ncbi:MAG: serine/threonine-protein kinase [Sandaracinus sp.]
MNDAHATRLCPRCGARYGNDATFCRNDGTPLVAIAAPAPSDPLVGTVLLGQFRIDRRIGEGGMGAVYRARQLSVGRDVAIKLLHPDLAASADAAKRFEREGRLGGAIDHPNVVRVFLSGRLPDGSLYLVMELLEGITLADLLRAEPVLALPRTLHILEQIALALGAAHDEGVVHRDIKPENVILVRKNRDPDFVKVLDFGIARRAALDEAIRLTAAGLVLGTALYISPEAASGLPVDARSDVYSLGVLAYRMLAGVLPFDASSPAGLLIKHLQQPPPPLVARSGPPIPYAIADVVMRALAKSPADRYADANALAEALAEAAARAGVEFGRPRTSELSAITRLPPVASGEPRASSPSDEPIPDDEVPSEGGPSVLVLVTSFILGALVVFFVMLWPRASAHPATAQVRAEQVKRAEEALAQHRWEGPDGVLATTDALLAGSPDDPDALRIRRSAASELVEMGDRERAAGHEDAARADYDRALAMLVGDAPGGARITPYEGPTAAPRREAIVVAPAPRSGEPVMITATIDEHDPLPAAPPRLAILENGRRVGGLVEAAPTGTPGVYAASYTFAQPGTFVIECRVGEGESAFAFRTEIHVERGPRPPRPTGGGGGGPGPVTTQG